MPRTQPLDTPLSAYYGPGDLADHDPALDDELAPVDDSLDRYEAWQTYAETCERAGIRW